MEQNRQTYQNEQRDNEWVEDQDYYERPSRQREHRNRYETNTYEMSIGQWMLTLFLAGIPLVGFVLLIVWAVSGSHDYPARKSWAAATLIWGIIVSILMFVLTSLLGVSLFSALNS